MTDVTVVPLVQPVSDRDVEIYAEKLYAVVRDRLQVEMDGDLERQAVGRISGVAPHASRWNELQEDARRLWLAHAADLLRIEALHAAEYAAEVV